MNLPPDVIGHMAGLGHTDEAIEICPSCFRSLLYGTAFRLSAAMSWLKEGNVECAQAAGDEAIDTLLELIKADFGACTTEAIFDNDEDWRIAFQNFTQARIEHYVNMETGEIRFEAHEQLDEDQGDDGLSGVGAA